jgi:hypothetical protein
VPPDGVVMAPVDASGRRVCGGGSAIIEAFRAGSEPPPCDEGLVAAVAPSGAPAAGVSASPTINAADRRPEVGR